MADEPRPGLSTHEYVRRVGLCLLAAALIAVVGGWGNTDGVAWGKYVSFSPSLLESKTEGDLFEPFGRWGKRPAEASGVETQLSITKVVTHMIPMEPHNCTETGKHCCDKHAPFGLSPSISSAHTPALSLPSHAHPRKILPL